MIARKRVVRQNEGGLSRNVMGCHIEVFLAIPHDAA